MTAAIFSTPAAAQAARQAYAQALQHWPLPLQQVELATRQGPTVVHVCGATTAPALVLLHGSQANAASWMGYATLLGAHFRLYLVDVVGEAGFSAPTRPALAGGDCAHWLGEVLQGLGLDSAAFAGISLGAWLALDLALRQPQRVRALALMCPPGIGPQKPWLRQLWPWLLLGRWGRQQIRTQVMGPRPTSPTPGEQALFTMMDAIDAGFRPRREPIPMFGDAQLQALQPPLLVVAGAQDVLLDSAATAARLQRLLPQAELRIKADQPHFVRGQGPVFCDFLRRHMPDGESP